MADPDARAEGAAPSEGLPIRVHPMHYAPPLAAGGLSLGLGAAAAWIAAAPFLLPLAVTLAAALVRWRADRRMTLLQDRMLEGDRPGVAVPRSRGPDLLRWRSDHRVREVAELVALVMGLTALAAAIGWALRVGIEWEDPSTLLHLEIGLLAGGTIWATAIAVRAALRPSPFTFPRGAGG